MSASPSSAVDVKPSVIPYDFESGAGAVPLASPGFEGVEKVMEIDFAPGFGPERGLREIARLDWDAVLTDAKCTVLDTLSNDRLDSYVLSESSLFVYPLKLVLKTCGTTTLLMALPRLLELTTVSVVGYVVLCCCPNVLGAGMQNTCFFVLHIHKNVLFLTHFSPSSSSSSSSPSRPSQ